jgi:hypothetical protein
LTHYGQWPRFNPILTSTGSEVSATTPKHSRVQTPAAPSMRRRPPSIDCPIQATSALWHATVIKAIFRDENRYFDTDTSSISAIPFTKNQRIREQPTDSEAVEVWEAKRACTFNAQFFGRGGACAALQNHGLDTCGGNCADACCRNRPHERVHFLVNRCDGCHSRYEYADRLPNRDEHSWSPGGCIIKVGALNVGSALHALTARA